MIADFLTDRRLAYVRTGHLDRDEDRWIGLLRESNTDDHDDLVFFGRDVAGELRYTTVGLGEPHTRHHRVGIYDEIEPVSVDARVIGRPIGQGIDVGIDATFTCHDRSAS